MAKQKTKRCPNCGRETMVDDKWSCKWCHYPLEESAPWRLTWKWVVGCLVAIIILYAVVLLDYSNWEVSGFLESIPGQWHILLLAILIPLGFLYFFVYLAPKIPPAVVFATLIIAGMLLLFSSDRQSILHKYISSWLDGMYDLNLFTAAITVLSLAFAFGGILIIADKNK